MNRDAVDPFAPAAEKWGVNRNSGYGLPGFDFAVELAARTSVFLINAVFWRIGVSQLPVAPP